MYPTVLLQGLRNTERKHILDVAGNGGYEYNRYGECCLSDEDDDGVDYSDCCTPEELTEFQERREQKRAGCYAVG